MSDGEHERNVLLMAWGDPLEVPFGCDGVVVDVSSSVSDKLSFLPCSLGSLLLSDFCSEILLSQFL